jgi:hypothetical protein
LHGIESLSDSDGWSDGNVVHGTEDTDIAADINKLE